MIEGKKTSYILCMPRYDQRELLLQQILGVFTVESPKFRFCSYAFTVQNACSYVLHASFIAVIVSSNTCSPYFEGKVLYIFHYSSIFDTRYRELNFNSIKFK